MARRRLDQIGEIVGLDVEGAGIFQHALQLAVIERAVDHRHNGEIFYRLFGERSVLQDRHEVGWLDRGKRPEVGEAAAAQQIVPRRQDARGIRVGERPSAGQRHLAHSTQDGVALAMADGAHLVSPSG